MEDVKVELIGSAGGNRWGIIGESSGSTYESFGVAYTDKRAVQAWANGWNAAASHSRRHAEDVARRTNDVVCDCEPGQDHHCGAVA